MTVLFSAIAFLACLIGRICGMGGGVLMKPVLDAAGQLPIATVDFLSGCTVMAMALWSVSKNALQKDVALNLRISTPLAIGAAGGGLLGKELFQMVAALFSEESRAGIVQAALLLIATFCTLLYTIKKSRVRSYHVNNTLLSLLIGLFLGTLGAFLGIGGGPFNMAVLFFFYSMPVKAAAKNSLYIVLISQMTALLFTALSTGVPRVSQALLIGMVTCGIFGSEAGTRAAGLLSEKKTTDLFLVTMVSVMGICVYNILRQL